jgi:hypothetical protein
MPQQAPLLSATGTRRMRLSSSARQQSSMLVSGVTVTHGVDITSLTRVRLGSLPVATTRQVMSRSVITPRSFSRDSRNYLEIMDLRQAGQNFLLSPIAKMFLITGLAKIDEWENGDAFFPAPLGSGTSEATIFSKRGSPRSESHTSSIFSRP